MEQNPKAKSAIPADDLERQLHVVNADSADAPHVGVVGDTYTILVSGRDTAGRYSAIDMLVPPGGGPPPHRHDFEEMFTVLEGAVEFTFRGEKLVATQGNTISVPANAPHFFRNATTVPARLLCVCSPAGQEEFFMEIGTVVAARTSPAPALHGDEQKAFVERAKSLAPKYRTEILGL
jgi:quercetin dioxygenase-like cupin family protein